MGTPAFIFLLSLITLTACGSQSNKHSLDPLVVSEEYALKHYRKGDVPQGLQRQWHVQDHGEIWTVELSTQGAVGGGIRMAIDKRDGRVIGSERTQ